MATITLTLPTAGTVITAGLHSNNYTTLQNVINGGLDVNNIATAAGIKGSQLASGLTGAPGTMLTHNELTALASITATTEATANTVVTASAFSFDGATPVMIDFFAPRNDKGTTNMAFWLYDGAASIGQLGLFAGATTTPIRLGRRLTPSNASHTYSIRATVDAGTGTVNATAGGLGAIMPAYIRITKE